MELIYQSQTFYLPPVSESLTLIKQFCTNANMSSSSLIRHVPNPKFTNFFNDLCGFSLFSCIGESFLCILQRQFLIDAHVLTILTGILYLRFTANAMNSCHRYSFRICSRRVYLFTAFRNIIADCILSILLVFKLRC